MKKIVTAWIICVLGLVALLAFLGSKALPQQTAIESGEALVRADFTLTTAGNKTIAAKDLQGRYMLVFFGFTYCPSICPTTLLIMSNALSNIGDIAEKIQPIFITIDPERDTPEITDTYVKRFNKKFIGLSGTAEQVKAAEDAFKVYVSKTSDATAKGGYMIDHSAFIYLMAPDGKFITHFASDVSEQELQKALRENVK